ncbi:hypothetical protein V8E51_015925 [Hyaloscypha variabilis]
MSSRAPRSSTSSTYPGLWSEWIWSEENRRYYRTRLEGKDEYGYEWAGATNPGPPGEDSQSLTEPLQTTKCSDELDPAAEAACNDDIPPSFSLPTLEPAFNPYPVAVQNAATYPSTDNVAAYPDSVSHVAATRSAGVSAYRAQDYTTIIINIGGQFHIRTRDPHADFEEFDPRP